MPRASTIDRALPSKSRLSWIITIAILLLGLVVLILIFSPGERQRRGAMDQLDFGDEAQKVTSLLGPPLECRPDSLEHLRGSFREGWSPRAAEAALQRLESETDARWIYPLDTREVGRCDGAERQTEIGLDAEGRVLWYVTITGKTGLRLPAEYAADAGGP